MRSGNKSILIVGAGPEQITSIHRARALGLRTVAVDGNPQAPGLKLADQGAALDIREVELLVEMGRREKVDGIFCHAVEIAPIIARAAKHLGLPGLRPEVADRATDKEQRYQCFKKNGVPCPNFESVGSAREAAAAAARFEYPVVLKPIDCAGARGVQKVETPDDVSVAYERAVSFSRSRTVLVEEFLSGTEISTESVIVNGRIVTTGFADRNYDKKEKYAPYFIEDGHTIPSILPAEARRKVIDAAETAIRALGIDWGVAKGDLIYDGEAKVFEMACRTSGGRFCSDMVPLSSGVDILTELIRMAVGEPVDERNLAPKFSKGAAQRFILPPPGIIRSLDGVEEARRMPGVYDIQLAEFCRVGGTVLRLANHADRAGHVIAEGRDRDEAVKRAEAAVERIRISVEN